MKLDPEGPLTLLKLHHYSVAMCSVEVVSAPFLFVTLVLVNLLTHILASGLWLILGYFVLWRTTPRAFLQLWWRPSHHLCDGFSQSWQLAQSNAVLTSDTSHGQLWVNCYLLFNMCELRDSNCLNRVRCRLNSRALSTKKTLKFLRIHGNICVRIIPMNTEKGTFWHL